MLKGKIAPSMMCAKIFETQETVKTFEKHNIEYLHIDVMDGSFVPNFQLGIDYIKQLREVSTIPLDVHLMIDRPQDKLAWFAPKEKEYFSIHYEATAHPQRVLQQIRDFGAKPMIALNPSTPLCVLEDILDYIDAVLIMSVNPGYAGQALVASALPKITRLRKLLDDAGKHNVEIEVDGNVSFENAKLMKASGANIYVVGSSSVFHKDYTLEEGISKLRGII